uniref:Zinc finger MYM-type protein 1 n=1 Tax=Sipha flava TaxID=143950 RepID=A0A2S2QPK6_9HEMI
MAERGLPFRGDKEKFGSFNNGNFLGLLELLAKFDPFLASHIKEFGNKGSGVTSYLSKTICDEFIHIMAHKVRDSILDDLRTAGYFSLSVDSTPDWSRIDQLTVIVRYVSPNDGLPIERFLTFLEMGNHTGESMAKMVHNYLINECKIDFSKCRGQSYDNSANMSGKYKGMQEIILKINKYAMYIPCAGHSLNLVGRSVSI